MTEVVNLLETACEEQLDRPGHRFAKTPFGERLGAELLGGTLYELPPGEETWPYHFHHAAEETIVVVSGELTVRTPGGDRVLRAGDVVAFTRGPEGAHAERNDGTEPVRFLVLSTRPPLDVTETPDVVNVYTPGATLRLRRDATSDLWGDSA